MTAKKLLIFGDSWPRGAELKLHERAFGELLALKFSVPVMNYSELSTSIPHLLLQLKQATSAQNNHSQFDHQDSDAIFFLTNPDRDLIWDINGAKELHLNPNHPEDIDIQWYTQIHSPNLSCYRVNTTLLALQKFCEIHQIKDHYIWGWQKIPLWDEVNKAKFWQHGRKTILDLFIDHDTVDCNGTLQDYSNHKNRYIWPNLGHPNQRGHQLIADALRDWLASCT